MVVPIAKCIEVAVELRDAYYLPLVELLFEGAEQAFDSAVLPRAAGISALVTDAEPFQPETEFVRSKNGFVVGTDDLGFAVSADDFKQASEQGMRRFFVQRTEMQ